MLLVASPAYPQPPSDGDKLSWSNLLPHLAELVPLHGVFGFMSSMEARDATFDRRFASLDVISTPDFEVALRAGVLELRGRPSAFGRRATPRWRGAVVAAANRTRPSGILLLGTSGGYVPELPSPTWLDLLDVRSRVRTTAGDRVTRRRILDTELKLAERHRLILASESDRDWLAKHGAADSRIAIVPHGVDARLFELTPQRDSTILLFVGSLRYSPNRQGLSWFLRHSWPRIRSENSKAILQVVGYGAERVPASERVEVHPNVPDVRPFYAGATVAIAPLLEARGVQHKALEAMAAGLPLVCTSPVAEGLFPDHPAIVCEPSEDFAAACRTLLADPAQRRERGELGHEYVRRHHDWAQSARLVLEILAH